MHFFHRVLQGSFAQSLLLVKQLQKWIFKDRTASFLLIYYVASSKPVNNKDSCITVG